MNPHFFAAPFYFAFIWFKVQGSGLRWRLRRLFLEDGILVSQPSPLGNAIKLSKILIAHVGNSVCFFHAFFLKVNNKTKN